MKKHKHTSYQYDWKNKIGWPYKDDPLDDPQYIKDRDAFFKENGIKDIILGETTEKQREMPKLRIKIYIFLRNDF